MSQTDDATEPTRIDLADPAYHEAPHRVLREARESHPVAITTGGDVMVLRFADVEGLARDPRLQSNAVPLLTGVGVTEGPLLEWWKLMLTNRNGPEHQQQRGLVSRAFTPRAIDALRPRIRELTRQRLQAAAERQHMDFVAELADPLPAAVMCELMGVDESEHDAFARWSADLGDGLASVMTAERRRRAEAAVLALNERIAELIGERRTRPGDDLLSALLRAADDEPGAYTEAELVTLVINLIFGGHDTSRSLLTAAVDLLLSHPESIALLRREPALVVNATEEILRCEPPVPVLAREPRETLEVAGIALPPGRMVLLSVLSANRDPRVFSDPDRFDITRPIQRSFSFGLGPHHCLGAALARAELQEVIPTLLETCRRIEREGPAPGWVPFMSIRRLEGLRIRFESA